MDREAQFLQFLSDGEGRWRAIARSYAPLDAEDLFQEILLQIWRSLASFRDESSGRTWCYRVALNTAMNWNRAKRNRATRLPIRQDYHTADLPAAAPADDSLAVIYRLLAEQTPADRALLLLLLDDVGSSEMAEILGTTQGAVRVRIHRLKQRLRERYEGLFDEL